MGIVSILLLLGLDQIRLGERRKGFFLEVDSMGNCCFARTSFSIIEEEFGSDSIVFQMGKSRAIISCTCYNVEFGGE